MPCTTQTSDYIEIPVDETFSSDEQVIEQEVEQVRTQEVTISYYTIGDNYTPNTITATGENPYVGMCAFNGVPFGTIIIYQDKSYVVKDRSWDDGVLDIYCDTIEECYEGGTKVDTVIIREGNQ